MYGGKALPVRVLMITAVATFAWKTTGLRGERRRGDLHSHHYMRE